MPDTREAIICEVGKMYMKYGIRSVSMDDIAQHQGISKKTLYQHFEDKSDLVKQVTTALLKERLKAYDEIKDTAANAIEELYSISQLLRKHFSELNPSLVYDLQKYYPEAWALFGEYENEVAYKLVYANLQKGIKEGYFRKEINPAVLAKVRVEQIHLSFNEELFPKEEFDFTEVQLQIFDHYVHGLLTESGLELYKKYQMQSNE